jgi:hypothetical protein
MFVRARGLGFARAITETIMRRLSFAFALLALGLAPSLAGAGTFPVPAENPIATVSIPDSWSPNAYDKGVEGTSSDGKLYVAFESVDAADVKSATEEGLKYYIKNGVTIDQASMKTKDIKINNLDAFDLSFTGTDKSGPANISLTLVQTNAAGKFLLLYYWGSSEGEKANGADLKAISDSIQATK